MPPQFTSIGYAGGISPDNVAEVAKRIDDDIDDDASFWLDMESGVRDVSGDTFDLRSVRRVLESLAPMVRAPVSSQ